MMGQMDIFDYIETEKPLSISDIMIHDLLRGSGFGDGKTRIYHFFQRELDKKKRADFLRNEYGNGGWSGEYKGIRYLSNHDSKGIDIQLKQMIGKAVALHAGWLMVEKDISELIETGLYLDAQQNVEVVS